MCSLDAEAITRSIVLRRCGSRALVRGERGNWEELFVNMQLAEVAEGVGKRWLITTIYKQGSAM